MEDLSKSLQIAILIAKSFQDELTKTEQEALDEWLSNAKNREHYEKLRQFNPAAREKEIQQLQTKNSWKRLEKQILFPRPMRKFYFARYAAIILLLLSVGTWIYLRPLSREQVSIELCEQSAPDPGSSRAILITESGEQVELQADKNFRLKNDSSVVLNNSGNTLEVVVAQKQSAQMSYQTLVIPRGGEYKLILSDGSCVWLNSGTKLRFPSVFSGQKRIVYLEGEAYFEVAHNAAQPFIVSTKEVEVEVLGTKFNMKAYAEDDVVYTTLAEGSVKAIHQETGASLLLQPNQQAQYTKQDRNFVKQEIDARLAFGWIYGRFIFENETLEEIMKQLGRWYDIEVFYQNPQVQKFRFTGDVDRFDDISILLRMIEKTYNITFTVNRKTVIIGNR